MTRACLRAEDESETIASATRGVTLAPAARIKESGCSYLREKDYKYRDVKIDAEVEVVPVSLVSLSATDKSCGFLPRCSSKFTQKKSLHSTKTLDMID